MRLRDLTGLNVGMLTVLYRDGIVGGAPGWRVRCECGREKTVRRDTLTRPKPVYSCGCKTNELISIIATRHGRSRTPTYESWHQARARCDNPRNKSYGYYGGRGIRMCARWAESFASFLEDMGERPGPEYSLDRINVNGDYEPGNCRWATQQEQQRNRRSNRLVTHNGETLTIIEWSERTGLSNAVISYRLDRGWGVADALTRPLRMDSSVNARRYWQSRTKDSAVDSSR